MEYIINNNRDSVYAILLNLIEESRKIKDKKKYLEKRGAIDFLVSNLSNSRISNVGISNYKNTTKLINKLFVEAKINGYYNIIKFIYSDMTSFTQNLRRIKRTFLMNQDESIEDVISMLEIHLKVIATSYMIARDSKWKNILTTAIRNLGAEDQLKYKSKIPAVIKDLADVIFDNDFSDPYYSMSTSEMEEVITKLFEFGPPDGFPVEKFNSSMMTLIQKYTTSYFSFKEENLYHITNKNNFINMLNNNETWIRKTEFLNDPKEQISFKKIVGHTTLINRDPNNNYISMSLTTSNVPKETISRYSNSIKEALVIEYNRFSVQNMLAPLRTQEICENFGVIVNPGSLIGKVVYDKIEMKEIWEKIEKFILKIENKFGKDIALAAREKSANTCKMFFKDSKWSNEKEVRVVANGFEGAFNVKEEESILKFSPSTMTTYKNVYFNDHNKELEQVICNQKIIKEAFEVSQSFKQYNSNSDKPKFNSTFKTINDFLENSSKQS